MSYFAEPHFIIYDEWFDDDIEKKKLEFKIKKTKPITNMHEFFYEQSNFKIGASENNMQLNIKKIKKEIFFNNYLDNTSENYASVTYKKYSFLSDQDCDQLS